MLPGKNILIIGLSVLSVELTVFASLVKHAHIDTVMQENGRFEILRMAEKQKEHETILKEITRRKKSATQEKYSDGH